MGFKEYSGGLKFAVMLNSMTVQQWQYESLKSLLEEPKVNPVLVIMNDSKQAPAKRFWNKITGYKWQNFFFKQYYRYFFRPSVFKAMQVQDLFSNIPVIKCKTLKSRVSEFFADEDLSLITKYEPDFIIKFGFGIIRGEILNCTPLGVWSFHHGDEQKYRGVPPGFWEIYYNDHRTGTILQRLTEKLDSGVILRKGIFKTVEHSWKGNLEQSIHFSKHWPAHVCKEIINQGTFPDQTDGVSTNAPLYKVPGNTTFFLFMFKLFFNKIKFHYNELFRCENWQLGVIKARTADILGTLQYEIDLEEVDFLEARNTNYYFADGFAVKDGERLLLLFENYSYKERLGHLSSVWFNERDYTFTEPVDILREPWHLSYPFVFKYKGVTYCIPECKDRKNVELYKLDTVSMKLVHLRTLIKDLEAVDPSLIYHQNHWYLFFTAGYATNTELHIWHAENLEDEFVPHVLNPVKSNVSNSRPAGSLFYLDGKLYRPSQDCSRSYGGRVIINEIKVLTEESFLEVTVNVLEPPHGFEGIHNISFAGDSMLFDCKKMKFSSANFLNQLKRKLRIPN
ncbi:MAG TPA: hypothetical protein VK212_05055 [Lentimicrobium sp.]|nr:hypothetical protein [Lentimicrobium sp.]